MLTASNLRFSYDGVVRALDDVSLSIGGGELVGLIGANGSGKSTLIRAILDLVQTTAGAVTLNGHNSVSVPAKLAAAAVTSLNSLPEYLTGAEYVTFMTKMYGVRTSRDRIAEQFERFSMPGREKDLIEDYSHGMRKKTQILTAFVLDRDLTILDETLNGIDLSSQRIVENLMEQQVAAGKSVLLCTHDLALLENHATRILVMSTGHIVADYRIDEAISAFGSLSVLVTDMFELRGV